MSKAANTPPSDARILNELRTAVAEGRLHPANLQGMDGAGTWMDRLMNTFFWGASALARHLPRWFGYPLFAGIGQMIGWLTPAVRRALSARLRLAFPQASPQRLAQIRTQFWRNFGRTLFEMLDYERFVATLATAVDVEGLENVQSSAEDPRPLVLIHNHQANWEIMFPIFCRLFQQPTSGIYAPLSIPALHRRVLHRRMQSNILPLPRHMGGPMRRLIQHLSAQGPIIVTLDQRVPGVWHPFFDKPASTTLIPIQVAQRAGARLIPIEVQRRGPSGHFRLIFHPSLLPPPGFEDPAAVEVLSTYNALLESWIRAHPADWFWLHDRWKA